MKILVLITNNKEITDNISHIKPDNLEIITLKEDDLSACYLEEYIPDFIIFDSDKKLENLRIFLRKNPLTKIFMHRYSDFYKEHKNIIIIEKISCSDSIKKIIRIINSLENPGGENKNFKVSENLKVISQHTVSFLSIKGGSGSTSSALNIAAIASEEFNLKTAFIDMNFSEAVSDTSLYLETENIPNLYYYFLNYEEGKRALENSVSFRSKKGLDIFVSPGSSQFINKLDRDIFSSFLYQLKSNYNFIIFDYPANLFSVNSFFDSIADFTDFFLATSFPTEICAKKTYAVNRLIGEGKGIFVILNNSCFFKGIGKKEFEKISGSSVISEIPWLNLKIHKKLRIGDKDTEIIDTRNYLRCFFNNYLMV